MHLFLAALLVPPSAAPTPSPKPLRSTPLVERVHRLQPMRSFKHLSAWFEARGRLDRALEIVAFALAHDPGDPELLAAAARLHAALGDADGARVYAHRALAGRPDDRATARLLEALGRPEGTPSTPATSAPAPSPAAASAPATPTTAPPSFEEQLSLHSLMKLVASTVRAYDLHHPKKPMVKLDLKALQADKLLPADLEHPRLRELTLEAGEPKLGTLGLKELEGKVGGYKKAVAELRAWVDTGRPYEALRDLPALEARYGRTADLRAVRDSALRQVDPRRALEEAGGSEPLSPGLAYEQALMLWKGGRPDRAMAAFDRLAARWPDSIHAGLGKRLRPLAEKGLDLDFLETFYAARQRSLGASGPTTATSAPPAVPGPAPAPVPSPR